MNILHINTSGVGGAAIAVQRLHELMIENGIDSNILYLYNNCPHKKGYHLFLKADVIYLHWVLGGFLNF